MASWARDSSAMVVKRMQQCTASGADGTASNAKRGFVKLCVFTLSAILPITVGAEAFATASSSRAFRTKTLIGIVDLGVPDGRMGCGSLSVSPDGNYVAIQTRQAHLDTNATEIRWRVLPIREAGIAANIGDGGTPIEFFTNYGYRSGTSINENAQWSPDSKWIAYRVGHKGKNRAVAQSQRWLRARKRSRVVRLIFRIFGGPPMAAGSSLQLRNRMSVHRTRTMRPRLVIITMGGLSQFSVLGQFKKRVISVSMRWD